MIYNETNTGNLRRGDVVFVNKNGERTVGSEQQAGRFAVVVSNNLANEYSRVIEVVYATSRSKTTLPTHMHINIEVDSTLQCEQVHSIDKSRLGYVKGYLTEDEIKEMNKCLRISLGL